MQLRTFLIALAVLIMCGGFLSAQTQSGSETGIEGVIAISPIKAGPVRQPYAPSSRPLANAAFVAENQKGEVASFTTDGQGRFRIPLSPGALQSFAQGKDKQYRALWTVRSRCRGWPNDKGPVAMRLGHAIIERTMI